jgi:hypothetical protein
MNGGQTWDRKCKLPQPAHEKERMWEGKMLPGSNMKKKKYNLYGNNMDAPYFKHNSMQIPTNIFLYFF